MAHRRRTLFYAISCFGAPEYVATQVAFDRALRIIAAVYVEIVIVSL